MEISTTTRKIGMAISHKMNKGIIYKYMNGFRRMVREGWINNISPRVWREKAITIKKAI